jgi:hypothetical protein
MRNARRQEKAGLGSSWFRGFLIVPYCRSQNSAERLRAKLSQDCDLVQSRQLLEHCAGFVVGGLVGVVGWSVAGGRAAGFGGVIASRGFVAAGERELGEFEAGICALQDGECSSS